MRYWRALHGHTRQLLRLLRPHDHAHSFTRTRARTEGVKLEVMAYSPRSYPTASALPAPHDHAHSFTRTRTFRAG